MINDVFDILSLTSLFLQVCIAIYTFWAFSNMTKTTREVWNWFFFAMLSLLVTRLLHTSSCLELINYSQYYSISMFITSGCFFIFIYKLRALCDKRRREFDDKKD